MRVLSPDGVAQWFKEFENLGVEPDYVHADEHRLFFMCWFSLKWKEGALR
jgi:hypothetical protein